MVDKTKTLVSQLVSLAVSKYIGDDEDNLLRDLQAVAASGSPFLVQVVLPINVDGYAFGVKLVSATVNTSRGELISYAKKLDSETEKNDALVANILLSQSNVMQAGVSALNTAFQEGNKELIHSMLESAAEMMEYSNNRKEEGV